MQALTQLFSTLRDRRRQKRTAEIDGLRDLLYQMALAEIGREHKEINTEAAADLIKQSGLSPSDIEATIGGIVSRFHQCKLAAVADSRQQAAVAAEAAYHAFDVEEAARRKAALQHLADLQAAMSAAIGSAAAADTAKGDLLASATISQRERELTAQGVDLKADIDKLQTILSPNAHRPVGGGSYMVDIHPAAMLREVRQQLAEIANPSSSADKSPARKSELLARLKVCEEAVAQREAELVTLQNQLAAVNAELQSFNASKLSPEAFEIKRVSPSRDDRAKARARRLGYSADAGLYVEA